MKRTIRLTEADLVKLVKRVVKESAVGTSSIDRIQAIFDCTGLRTAGAGWTAQVFEIEAKMPFLSKLMSLTDDLNMSGTSKWDEQGIMRWVLSIDDNKSERDKIQKVLTCYLKKTNTPIHANNPILTILKYNSKYTWAKPFLDILYKMGINP